MGIRACLTIPWLEPNLLVDPRSISCERGHAGHEVPCIRLWASRCQQARDAIYKRLDLTQLPAMPAKHIPAIRLAAALGLGLLVTGCGPIAFQDTVAFKNPEPKPKAEPKPKTEAAAPKPRAVRARVEGNQIVIDEMIQFEYDSAEILPVSHAILDDVVKVMQDNPNIEQVDIVGHTSSEGSLKHNNTLSTNRAAAVKDYLIEHGIDEGRLTSQGKGPSEPIADNDTEEGRIANRRVEFKIIKPANAGGTRARPSGK